MSLNSRLSRELHKFSNSIMNGPKNNDKKLRRLVEAIEIDALEEMERCTIGKSVFLILTQVACRARRTLEKSLTVVFWVRYYSRATNTQRCGILESEKRDVSDTRRAR